MKISSVATARVNVVSSQHVQDRVTLCHSQLQICKHIERMLISIGMYGQSQIPTSSDHACTHGQLRYVYEQDMSISHCDISDTLGARSEDTNDEI